MLANQELQVTLAAPCDKHELLPISPTSTHLRVNKQHPALAVLHDERVLHSSAALGQVRLPPGLKLRYIRQAGAELKAGGHADLMLLQDSLPAVLDLVVQRRRSAEEGDKDRLLTALGDSLVQGSWGGPHTHVYLHMG